jgi:hypothetical protein
MEDDKIDPYERLLWARSLGGQTCDSLIPSVQHPQLTCKKQTPKHTQVFNAYRICSSAWWPSRDTERERERTMAYMPKKETRHLKDTTTSNGKVPNLAWFSNSPHIRLWTLLGSLWRLYTIHIQTPIQIEFQTPYLKSIFTFRLS